MSVTLLKTVKLLLAAGAAKPGPAIGQALGPLGLNMSDFWYVCIYIYILLHL